MSTPNPLAPQGSLLEQQARSKSSLQIAALIVGLHVFVIGGLLILGCDKEKKQTQTESGTGSTLGSAVAPDTNLLSTGIDPYASSNAAPIPSLPAYPSPASNVPPVVAPVVPDHPPVVTDATSPAPLAGASEYKVKAGDNPAKIAKAHGVTTKALLEANAGLDPKKLKPGMTIQIPGGSSTSTSIKSPTTSGTTHTSGDGPKTSSTPSGETTEYTVKGGDNLSKIARKFGTTVKEIKALNGLKNNNITKGKKLKVPGKAAEEVPTKSAPPTSPGTPTSTAPISSRP